MLASLLVSVRAPRFTLTGQGAMRLSALEETRQER